MTPRTRALLIALMTVMLVACAVRLVPYVRFIARHSLQADFSAYYIAGKSLNQGRSPYLNHAADERSLWDGVSLWRPSRFLYPPLAALPFRALAALPYAAAKVAWLALTFALAAAALLLARRASGQRQWAVLLAGAVWLVGGWPFLLELERGQVDFITLGLILGATLLARRAGRLSAAGAGGLWALAILLKLHVAYALPFLLLRRRFAIVGYTVAGSAALLLLSIAVMPGPTTEYLTRTLPGLIEHGIDPQPDSKLPPAVLRSLLSGGPGTVAFAHGGRYLRFPLAFDDHASLVWALAGESAKVPGLLSFGLAGAMVLGVALACRRRQSGELGERDAADDLAWLVLALCSVLLAAPLTWPMNTVWLVPAVFVLFARGEPGRGWSRLGWLVGLIGLLLVAIPDRYAWPWPMALHWVSRHKYVLGELAVAVAMLLRLRRGAVLGSMPAMASAPRSSLVALAVAATLAVPARAAEAPDFAAALPARVGAWTKPARAERYDGKTLYDYIDGGAELYRAFGFVGALAFEYDAGDDDVIKVDLFDMGSARGAFGVFAHGRETVAAEIGQGSEYAAGLLTFWKGRWFVSVLGYPETPAKREAVYALGRAVAALVPETGRPPAIIEALPKRGLVAASVRTFHHPLLQNDYLTVSYDNPLGIGPDTEAVLARYVRGKGRHVLLLVDYPTVEAATAAQGAFTAKVLRGTTPARHGERWAGLERSGRRLAIVLDVSAKSTVSRLLSEVP